MVLLSDICTQNKTEISQMAKYIKADNMEDVLPGHVGISFGLRSKAVHDQRRFLVAERGDSAAAPSRSTAYGKLLWPPEIKNLSMAQLNFSGPWENISTLWQCLILQPYLT